MNEPTALLVMAYGTPSRRDDIAPFYTHIRRGRPPSDEQLAVLTARYDALGGVSPMARQTAEQVAVMASKATDAGFTSTVAGFKHSAPFVEDAVTTAAASATRIVGVVLAPHYSRASIGEYHRRARQAAADADCDYIAIDRWWDLDEHVAALGSHVRRCVEILPDAQVVFTAHSLPLRVLDGDPYRDELFASARAIASSAGLPRWGRWGLAWQSAGATAEPWASPDVLTVIDDLAATGRSPGLIVVPHGFCSEHLEVAYDLDIEAAGRAAQRGLPFRRTAVVGADSSVLEALVARAAAAATPPPSSPEAGR